MRVTHQSSFGWRSFFGLFQQRFQSSSGPFQEERFNLSRQKV
jgi:hypothetical protein